MRKKKVVFPQRSLEMEELVDGVHRANERAIKRNEKEIAYCQQLLSYTKHSKKAHLLKQRIKMAKWILSVITDEDEDN